jgi:hypothetical protein
MSTKSSRLSQTNSIGRLPLLEDFKLNSDHKKSDRLELLDNIGFSKGVPESKRLLKMVDIP